MVRSHPHLLLHPTLEELGRLILFCDWWLCRESVVEACSAALQIDSSDTRALYRRYSSALPVRGS